MLTKDFYFELPEEQIAQQPSGVRGEDKLMVLDRNGFDQKATALISSDERTSNDGEKADSERTCYDGEKADSKRTCYDGEKADNEKTACNCIKTANEITACNNRKTDYYNPTDGKASVTHCTMKDLPDLIEPGTLMIFNNSRVRRSRCYGKTIDTGREAEFLFLENLSVEIASSLKENNASHLDKTEFSGSIWKAMVKNAKKQKPGKVYEFMDGTKGIILENPNDNGTEFRTVQFEKKITEDWFEHNGHIPLPPYIKREDTEDDSQRYQNVYAKETGSSACPTAGLHFTEEMLEKLKVKNIEIAYVTLHVGLGTFLPVRVDSITDHKMHEEYFSISEETADKINKAKKEGRTILAVGTTSVRTLESAWSGGTVAEGGYLPAGSHKTSIFITPGYKFKCVDKLFTNFHTPESTLMMLVSAFAGYNNIMQSYKKAVENKYRFFSYGDAMLIR